MEHSAIVERLFRPLASQRSGEPVPGLDRGSGPLEARLRAVLPRRLTVESVAWRAADDETLLTTPDVRAGDDVAEGARQSRQHEPPAASRLPVENAPEPPVLRPSPQRPDTPPTQTAEAPGYRTHAVEHRARTLPPEHKAEVERPRDSQSPPVTSASDAHLDRREEAARGQPHLRPMPANEPLPDSSGALWERPDGPSQPIESTFRPEPARPAVIPSAPELPQVLHGDGPFPTQLPTSEVPPTRRPIELLSRQESDMRQAEPAEDRQPATVEIRPARTEPTALPGSAATPEAPQEASKVPTSESQLRVLPPMPERQMPARVTLAIPATDRASERRTPQPASPRPSVTLSIGRIEIVTQQPSAPRRRSTRPRGHQIDPGLAYFRQG
jgi:hypothetical protein